MRQRLQRVQAAAGEVQAVEVQVLAAGSGARAHRDRAQQRWSCPRRRRRRSAARRRARSRCVSGRRRWQRRLVDDAERSRPGVVASARPASSSETTGSSGGSHGERACARQPLASAASSTALTSSLQVGRTVRRPSSCGPSGPTGSPKQQSAARPRRCRPAISVMRADVGGLELGQLDCVPTRANARPGSDADDPRGAGHADDVVALAGRRHRAARSAGSCWRGCCRVTTPPGRCVARTRWTPRLRPRWATSTTPSTNSGTSLASARTRRSRSPATAAPGPGALRSSSSRSCAPAALRTCSRRLQLGVQRDERAARQVLVEVGDDPDGVRQRARTP